MLFNVVLSKEKKKILNHGREFYRLSLYCTVLFLMANIRACNTDAEESVGQRTPMISFGFGPGSCAADLALEAPLVGGAQTPPWQKVVIKL